jgi:hypothetical protein
MAPFVTMVTTRWKRASRGRSNRFPPRGLLPSRAEKVGEKALTAVETTDAWLSGSGVSEHAPVVDVAYTNGIASVDPAHETLFYL